MLRCFILKDNVYLVDSHSLIWQKALKAIHQTDPKLEYFRKKMLEALEAQERVQKAGFPIGTIREWRGKKFIKIAPNKWRPKYDAHTRGAKLAIRAIKRKVDLATSSEELLQITLGNSSRFRDSNGHLLPFVEELRDYISTRNLEIESGKGKAKNNEHILTPQQQEKLKNINDILKKNTEPMPPKIEFTKNNFDKLFKNGIDSPIEHVKIGENQYEKLEAKGRGGLLSAMADVIKDPAMIIRTTNGAKLYVKSYSDDKGAKNIVSVIIDKYNLHISISTHIERNKQIAIKMDSILYSRTESAHGETPHGSLEQKPNVQLDISIPQNKEKSSKKDQLDGKIIDLLKSRMSLDTETTAVIMDKLPTLLKETSSSMKKAFIATLQKTIIDNKDKKNQNWNYCCYDKNNDNQFAGTNSINIWSKGNDAINTIMHEMGHAFDNVSGFVMWDDAMRESLATEAQAWIEALPEYCGGKFGTVTISARRGSVKADISDMARQKQEGSSYYGSICDMIKSKLSYSFREDASDIFSGITRNKIKDGYFHDTKYWSTKHDNGQDMLGMECVAEFFNTAMLPSSYNGGIREIFPKTLDIFEQKINNIYNGDINE